MSVIASSQGDEILTISFFNDSMSFALSNLSARIMMLFFADAYMTTMMFDSSDRAFRVG